MDFSIFSAKVCEKNEVVLKTGVIYLVKQFLFAAFSVVFILSKMMIAFDNFI